MIWQDELWLKIIARPIYNEANSSYTLIFYIKICLRSVWGPHYSEKLKVTLIRDKALKEFIKLKQLSLHKSNFVGMS